LMDGLNSAHGAESHHARTNISMQLIQASVVLRGVKPRPAGSQGSRCRTHSNVALFSRPVHDL
jgi:hypothetical protein